MSAPLIQIADVSVSPKTYRRTHRQLRLYMRRRMYAAGVHHLVPDADLSLKIRGGKIVNVYIGLCDPGVDADKAAERDDDPAPADDLALREM